MDRVMKKILSSVIFAMLAISTASIAQTPAAPASTSTSTSTSTPSTPATVTQTPAAVATVTVRKIPEGKSSAVPAFEKNGMTYVSIPAFAELAGFKHAQSVFSAKSVYSNDRGSITFIQDNLFYRVDTATNIMPYPPIRKESALYLPAPYLVKVFGAKHSGMLVWSAQTSAITVNAFTYNVSSVSIEVKQNGTLISIVMVDSLPYECTYYHPNLAVNFGGGRLDLSQRKSVKRGSRAGVVDSMFTLQYEESAQLSFILNQVVEPPYTEYNAKTRTLMISLKPKIEQKKPKPAASQVPLDASLIRTVVLDPGHGGKDPGAIGPTGVKEKDVVLGIGLELRTMLEKAGFKVFMTRDKDIFIPLGDRTRFANEKKADLFVSIHADAVGGDAKKRSAARGYKVYFLSQAKNEEDKMVAMRENAVIELEDKDKRSNYNALPAVLISIAGAEYLRESQDLCIFIEQSLGANVKQIPRLQLGVGQANFWVLNGAYMPSVLIEVGFISNTEEEKLLSDKRTQFQQAAALSEAVVKFKQQFEGGQ
jgi:N-acetylmuramoyl-L-alanine amidase